MNVSELKDFTELAQAAYAHFETMDYFDDDETAKTLSIFEETQNGTFSAQQA